MDTSMVFRGWQGHFCCECRWHLNTLVNDKYVVSTVGQHVSITDPDRFQPIGGDLDLFYETQVFWADQTDEWKDIDASRGEILMERYPDEKLAQDGHYRICERFQKE